MVKSRRIVLLNFDYWKCYSAAVADCMRLPNSPVAGMRITNPMIAKTIKLVINFSSMIGLVGSFGILAGVIFILGSLVIGYLMGGSDRGNKSVVGLGTAQRNISAALVVAAQNFGVGSIVAMGLVAHPDILHKELEIPDSLQIVIGVALGYQDEQSVINSYRSSRRPIQEVVTFKGF